MRILLILPLIFLYSKTLAQTPDSFNPNVTGGFVYSTVVQPDGKVLISGDFSAVGGVPRNRIARLNADGSLDLNFIVNTVSGTIFSMALQPDGKILLGGGFSLLGPTTRHYIVRLNADGSLDESFTDPATDSDVYCMLVQDDGKIIIGGGFSHLGSVYRTNIARLYADGTLDTGYTPSPNGQVYSMAMQSDGKIVIGGYFAGINGASHNRVGRVNADGTLDDTFTIGTGISNVYCVVVQPDGKILLGGDFTTVDSVTRNRMARLNADGTLDTGFNPNVGSTSVRSMALQADGKIVIGGIFTSAGGVTRNRVARLNTDGTLDTGYDPNVSSNVNSVCLQGDGKLLLGGNFSTVGGVTRSRIARVSNDSATQTLSVTGTSQIDWLRSGSTTEVERVTFDTWDGSAWVAQGAATRIAGGWRKTGLSLPASSWVRARGYAACGYYSSGSSIIEQVATYGGGTFPNISVEQPTATVLTDGQSKVDFGTRDWLTTSTLKTFTIRNTGNATLTGLALSVDGPHQGDFNVGSLAVTSLLSGGSTTFTVSFTPHGAHSRSAALHVSSNDADETMFDIALTGTGQHLDAAFNPGIDGGKVLSTLVQSDGKIVLGGDFVTAGGSLRNRMARLNQDGTLDTTFDPNVNGTVATMVTFPTTGKFTIGGSFTKVGGITKNNVARLFADGSWENGDVNANNTVACLAAQADDKTIVGGDFTTISSILLSRITRLVTAGYNDIPGFHPDASGTVNSVAVQADGKLVVCGGFSTIGGGTQVKLARLSSAGALDTSFTPNPGIISSPLECVAVQSDGKILVAGPFTTMNGVARSFLARLNSDGTLDTNFSPALDGAVTTMALQADGKILIGGAFTTVNWVSRSFVARLNADGSLDSGFDPGTDAAVSSLAIQADGKILMGGNFTNAGGLARNYFVRLPNDSAAAQTLSVTGTTQIDWVRGGSAPEVEQVTFETWNGSTWSSQGTATRVAGGWRKTGLSIPAGGWVRARGRSVGGRYMASSGLIEQTATYGTAYPDIAIEQPLGTGLVDGLASSQFGYAAIGEAKPLTFTIRNTGGASLTGIAITVDGSEAADFSVSTPGATTLAPGGSTTFTVTFTPADFGVRHAAIHIVSSDFDETPFDINLTGEGVSAQESWRNTYFGTISNSGNAADTLDFDHDGLVNLVEYAFGLNPVLGSSSQLPQGQRQGNSFQITFTTPAGVSGIAYEAEWSSSLAPADWIPIPDTGISPQHIFSVPVDSNTKMFMRLKVTGP